jgi:hypothetical protein
VIPVEQLLSNRSFSVFPRTDFPVSRLLTDGSTDLFMTVYPRPFGASSSTLANAGYIQTASWAFGRPIQGVINVNIAKLGTEIQSFTSMVDRELFEVLVHEQFHALGISGRAFEKWLNPNTHNAYGTNVPLYNISRSQYPQKVIQILHTPKLHELMKERLGIEYFENNVSWPVGVEIEDSGGTGTVGSHWEGRTFYTEVMIGTTFGWASISPVSLSALWDTGWYWPNMSLAEPLLWGDYRSIIGAKVSDFKNFVTQPPALNWPWHYVAHSQSQMQNMRCTFDHRYGGDVTRYFRNCVGITTDECAFPEFYDPGNIGYYGIRNLDYTLITTPYSNVNCRNPSHGDGMSGDYFGPGALCARTKLYKSSSGGYESYMGSCYRMVCDTSNNVIITIGPESDGKNVTCTTNGTAMKVSGYTGDIECPDPKVICGLLNRQAGPPSSQTPVPTVSQSPITTESSSIEENFIIGFTSVQFAFICVGVVVLIVVIVVVVVCIVRYRRRQRSVDEDEKRPAVWDIGLVPV